MIDIKKIVTVKHILELVFMTILYAMLDNVAGIKKYAVILALCMVFFVLGRKKKWSVEALFCIALPVISYVLLGSLGALVGTNSQISTVKVILYVLVPLILAFSMYVYYGKDMKHIVDMHFFGSILGYALFDAPYFAKIFQWESIYAFTFGIFVIYYAYQKKWVFCALAGLFVWFTEKRIAFLAVIVTLLLMGTLWLFRENKKLVFGFWGAVTGVVYLYLYLIYSGTMSAFCWGANINTNGRVEMYERVANEVKFSLGYLGKGLGTVENLLEHWNVSTYVNLHNDLLKFYIELGFIGLLVYLLSYIIMFYVTEKRFGKSKMCFLFGISAYTMLLFTTDNVSIYMLYLIPMYSTLFAVMASEKQVKIE